MPAIGRPTTTAPSQAEDPEPVLPMAVIEPAQLVVNLLRS
jgi:hypothetical protein